MISLTDYVFVEIEDSLYNENTGFKGIGGKEIVLDPTYDPQRHVKIAGKVCALPEELSRFPVSQETNGSPSYDQESNFRYKRREDISLEEIQIGDMVYFHFNTLASMDGEKNRVGNNIFKVAPENILCAVRDGNITMIGGYCLIEPDLETWEETLLPIPEKINGEVVVDKHGNPVMKPKAEWLTIKVEPEARPLQGFVRHIGKPLKGQEVDLKVGDKIIYRQNADWQQSIEGKTFYTIRQRHIIAKVE